MAGNIYTWSTTAATNATADADINWAEGQAPGSVNDSARGVMAGVAGFVKDNNGTIATTGSANAYAATSSNTIAALATGLRFRFKANFSNTGSCTLNLTPQGGAAFGAKAIKVITASGEADPKAGMIIINGHYQFCYDAAANSAAGAWLLLNPSYTNVGTPTVFQPSNPTGTTSTTGVMMGLGSTCAFTPVSTRVLVSFTGTIKNDTNGGGAFIGIRWGTGAAPANGAALTGTLVGGTPQLNPGTSGYSSGGAFFPISQTVAITGLTPGTAIWLDLELGSITTGTSILVNLTCTVCEI